MQVLPSLGLWLEADSEIAVLISQLTVDFHKAPYKNSQTQCLLQRVKSLQPSCTENKTVHPYAPAVVPQIAMTST